MIDLERLREGRPGCPSDLVFDRLVTGELAGEGRAAVDAHLASCDACGERMASRRRGFAAFPEADPGAIVERLRARAAEPAPVAEIRRLSRARTAVLAAIPLAAGVALFVGMRGSSTPVAPGETTTAPATVEAPTGVRDKGTLGLHVFREEKSGRSEEVVSGTKLAPGDRLRFAVDLPHPGDVRIVGIEATGSLYTAWPLSDSEVTRREAGAAQELPGAVALDASHGKETLYLVLCRKPGDAMRCTPGAGAPKCPDACELSPFVMEKP